MRRRIPQLPAALVLTVVLAGCQAARVSKPVTSALGDARAANTPEAQVDFWHTLNARPLASNDEAFHGLLLYFDGKDDSASYDQRLKTLKQRKWISRDFNEAADRAVERGTVAQALVTALKFKGGVTMQLFGASPRYALRELEYRGMLPESSPNQVFTGGEFVGVIGKVEDFRTGNPADVPAEFLPEEARLARGGATAPGDPVVVTMPERDEALVQAEEAASEPLRPFTDPHQMTLGNPIYAMMFADDAATQPQAGALKATVTKLQGTATFRTTPTGAWQPLKVGQTLAEDASIRTGVKGAVILTIPPDQTISIDRLTTVTILKAFQSRGKVTTDIGMEMGRTRYDIAGAGVEHEATIRSPNSNLAIRGTKVSLFDQRPFMPEAVSLTGRAMFNPIRRQAIAFGNKGLGKTVLRQDSTSAAQFALSQAFIDPSLAQARTPAEEALLNTLVSRGAIVSFDQDAGIRVVRGGGAPSDTQLANSLPGLLNFVVRWDGPANLDLALSTPKFPDGHSEFIYPIGGLDRSRSGGKIPFDHRGGAGGGIEVVYWPSNTFTGGTYAMSVQRVSGPPVNATIEAFLNGQPLNLDPDSFEPVTRVEKTVSADTGAVQFVDVPTQVPSRRSRRTLSAMTGRITPAPGPTVGPSIARPTKAR